VLYVFYEPIEGRFALLSYNLITKGLQNPIYSNGYALRSDGKLIIFSAEHEPTRVHPMQVWQTSYISAEYASQQPESTTELGKIGNSELVRGVSDLYSIHNLITLREVSTTAELVIDEFEKVQSIQHQSTQALSEAKSQQRKLLSTIATTTWENAAQELVHTETGLGEQTVEFLADETALDSYTQQTKEVTEAIEQAGTNAEIRPLLESIVETTSQLDLLSELITTLKIDAWIRRSDCAIFSPIQIVFAKHYQCLRRRRHP